MRLLNLIKSLNKEKATILLLIAKIAAFSLSTVSRNESVIYIMLSTVTFFDYHHIQYCRPSYRFLHYPRLSAFLLRLKNPKQPQILQYLMSPVHQIPLHFTEDLTYLYLYLFYLADCCLYQQILVHAVHYLERLSGYHPYFLHYQADYQHNLDEN